MTSDCGDRSRHLPSRAGASGARRILVTGGAGYIGSHVVRKLLARGHQVRVVDNYLYGAHGLHDLFGHPRLEVVQGDIRCDLTMMSAARDVDSIIALAALVGDAVSDLNIPETLSTNLEATRVLIDVGRRSGVRRIVFASTCSVYGANSNELLTEDSWVNPVSLYAKTRLQSEELLLDAKDDVSVAILRLATVFGLSSRMRLDLFVNTLTANAFFNRRVRVFGGWQWRPNLHVQDAADAFILVADAADEQVRGEVFNIGDEAMNLSVMDVANRVRMELPETEIEMRDNGTDERNYRVSSAKIRRILGCSAKRRLEDGIREMIRAFSTWTRTSGDEARSSNVEYLRLHGFPQVASYGWASK